MLSSIRESEAESFRATPCSTHAETNRHIASTRSGPHNATFKRVKKPAARRGPLTRRSTHIRLKRLSRLCCCEAPEVQALRTIRRIW
jgi:hypothetical protein